MTQMRSHVKRAFLLAQFLQRPDEYFEFDHENWQVIFTFHSYGVNDPRVRIIPFDATTEGILELHKTYIKFGIESKYTWERAVEMTIELLNRGIDKKITYVPQKINWGRDGF